MARFFRLAAPALFLALVWSAQSHAASPQGPMDCNAHDGIAIGSCAPGLLGTSTVYMPDSGRISAAPTPMRPAEAQQQALALKQKKVEVAVQLHN